MNNFEIVFEILIEWIDGMNCTKEETIADLLNLIESRYNLEYKTVSLRFINYDKSSRRNQAFCIIRRKMQDNIYIVNDLNGFMFREQPIEVRVNQMGTIDEIPIDDRLISYREVTRRVMEYPNMRAELEEASEEISNLRRRLAEAEGKAKEAEDKNYALTTQYSKVVKPVRR
jgi:hypothetical protein